MYPADQILQALTPNFRNGLEVVKVFATNIKEQRNVSEYLLLMSKAEQLTPAAHSYEDLETSRSKIKFPMLSMKNFVVTIQLPLASSKRIAIHFSSTHCQLKQEFFKTVNKVLFEPFDLMLKIKLGLFCNL